MTGDTQTTHHMAKLHFAGQRRQQTKPKVQHKVTNNQCYARGNNGLLRKVGPLVRVGDA